jgi:ribonuclease HIII
MTIVFKVSENVQKKMIDFYKNSFRSKKPPYSIFQAQSADVIITLYESGKVMFQGISADIEANIWKDQEMHLNNRNIDSEIKHQEKIKKEKYNDKENYKNINVIGSDEVGTGDYFGPIVVTATYVPKVQESYLIDLGVKDSKIITDEKIKKIAPEIIKNIPNKTFILTNADFNAYNKKGYNMNKIKAILHNKVLCLVKEEFKNDYEKIVVDQFVYPQKYFEHIKEATNKVTDITFTPRAENKCFAVACASIISRYIFLREMDKLSDSIHIPLPKGSGDNADDIGVEIVKKYGFDKLNEVAKVNFKNTEKIKNKMA